MNRIFWRTNRLCDQTAYPYLSSSLGQNIYRMSSSLGQTIYRMSSSLGQNTYRMSSSHGQNIYRMSSCLGQNIYCMSSSLGQNIPPIQPCPYNFHHHPPPPPATSSRCLLPVTSPLSYPILPHCHSLAPSPHLFPVQLTMRRCVPYVLRDTVGDVVGGKTVRTRTTVTGGKLCELDEFGKL